MISLDYHPIIALSPAQRVQASGQLTRMTRKLSLAGQRRNRPSLQGDDWGRHIAKLWISIDFIPQGNETMWIQDSVALAQQLHHIFETANIPYFITGGVASSTWGEPRATRDLDVVIQVSDRTNLAQSLETAGYLVAGLDSNTVQITHQQEITTADLIVAPDNEWERSRFSRRIWLEELGLWFISPEDLILSKLRWGQGKSDKQTRDVISILNITPNLDRPYLQTWADRLNIQLLLADVIQGKK
jgi:hypothetical protein